MKHIDKFVLKIFYQFLQDKNYYNLYEKNLTSMGGWTYRSHCFCEPPPSSFLASMSNIKPIKLISLAFMWRTTEEGWDFWNKVNDEWISYYNGKIKSIKI